MKYFKFKSLAALFVACGLLVAPLLTGCGSPIKTAYRTAGVTENAVNSALTAWAEYAVQREQTLPSLPPVAATNLVATLAKEKAQVDALYIEHEKYKALYQTAVRAYYESTAPDANALDIAFKAVQNSASTLVNLILTYLPEDKAKAVKAKAKL